MSTLIDLRTSNSFEKHSVLEREEREEAERKEKEEKEREYRERVAKLDEIERKRKEREREIEERESASRISDRDRPGYRDRDSDRWGPPRKDIRDERGKSAIWNIVLHYCKSITNLYCVQHFNFLLAAISK